MIKKISILALLFASTLGLASQSMADVYPLNKSPFRVWNSFIHKDSIFAPHNGFDRENIFKPWNRTFGTEDDLNSEERRAYGIDHW